jgi:hypothetical protein
MDATNRQAILVSVVQAPFLSFRIGVQYLRMKRSANKARGRFYKELINGGIPKQQARDLADEYVSAVSIRSIVKAVGMTGMSSRR